MARRQGSGWALRSAPAVSVCCTGGPCWRGLLWLLPALSAATVAIWAVLQADEAWGWSQPSGGGRGLLAAAGLLAFGLTAGVAQRWRPIPARLNWDGALWACDGQPVSPQVMLDTGGAWMLLRLWPVDRLNGDGPLVAPASEPLGAPPPRWLAVSRADAAGAWHAFRAAVYCAPPQPAPTATPHQPL